MPFVKVKITKDGVTTAQKVQLVAEITDTLQRVMRKEAGTHPYRYRGNRCRKLGLYGMLTSEYRQNLNDEKSKKITIT